MTQLTLNLNEARRRRDDGIAKVSAKNGTFLETARGVARILCRSCGQITADDVREGMQALYPNLQPTHYNAWGAIFRSPEWEMVGYTTSKQVQGHGNTVRVWRLKA